MELALDFKTQRTLVTRTREISMKKEETQGSTWTAMLPGNATPSKMPQCPVICIFIALLKYLNMVAIGFYLAFIL